MVLGRWEVLPVNFILSTTLIMWIGYRKEIRKLTVVSSVSPTERIDSLPGRANEKSAFESHYGSHFALSTRLIKTIFVKYVNYFPLTSSEISLLSEFVTSKSKYARVNYLVIAPLQLPVEGLLLLLKAATITYSVMQKRASCDISVY